MFECGLVSIATETLLEIVGYLTTYERLCLRITCKRFYSILSDPRAWHTLVWKDCRRKRGSDDKAFRLAVKLSMSTVRSIFILYPREQEIAKFVSSIHSCKQIHYLTLSGKISYAQILGGLLPELPSLYFFSITSARNMWFIKNIFTICAKVKTLKILCIVAHDD